MKEPINVGLWGGVSSGKTTYLAAVMGACVAPEFGWAVRSSDNPTIQRLNELVATLTRRALIDPSSIPYRWLLDFSGTRTRTVIRKRGLFGTPTTVQERQRSSFTLTCTDVPGDRYRNGAEGELLTELAKSDGLVYLYDPLRDLQAASSGGSNAEFFAQVLMSIPAEAPDSQYIRQRVAVCLVKYDDPLIFSRLEALGLVSRFDNSVRQTPQVANPREAFAQIADPAIQALLKAFIRPDRLSFFCTSSIGFYAPEGAVDPDDYFNLIETANGVRLRGPVRPTGVFEPLLWLSDEGWAGSTGA